MGVSDGSGPIDFPELVGAVADPLGWSREFSAQEPFSVLVEQGIDFSCAIGERASDQC